MKPCVLAWSVFGALMFAAGAEAQESAKVVLTVKAPAGAASFAGRTLEVFLFEFDPRIADKAATKLDTVLVKDFAHETGKDTVKEIVLAEKLKANAKMNYYVTVFVLEKDTRTHIGETDGKSGLNRVQVGSPNKVNIILRAVK